MIALDLVTMIRNDTALLCRHGLEVFYRLTEKFTSLGIMGPYFRVILKPLDITVP